MKRYGIDIKVEGGSRVQGIKISCMIEDKQFKDQRLKCKMTRRNSKIILHFDLSFLYLTFAV